MGNKHRGSDRAVNNSKISMLLQERGREGCNVVAFLQNRRLPSLKPLVAFDLCALWKLKVARNCVACHRKAPVTEIQND